MLCNLDPYEVIFNRVYLCLFLSALVAMSNC